jgi:hypothetical protein
VRPTVAWYKFVSFSNILGQSLDSPVDRPVTLPLSGTRRG